MVHLRFTAAAAAAELPSAQRETIACRRFACANCACAVCAALLAACLVVQLRAQLKPWPEEQQQGFRPVVQLLAFCRDPPCFVMEKCETSLMHRVTFLRQLQQQQPCKWRAWLRVLKQAATAVSLLHAPPEAMLHTDIKADNMLLQADGAAVNQQQDELWRLKICDFGLAAFPPGEEAPGQQEVENEVEVVLQHDVSNRNALWLAPELLALQPGGDDPPLATPAVDVYGLGEFLEPQALPVAR